MSKNTPHIPTARLDKIFNEQSLVTLSDQIINSDGSPITPVGTKARKVWESGYRFEDMLKGERNFIPFPKVITDICQRAISALTSQSGENIPSVDNFTNCIISQYNKGSNGILKYHIDMNKGHPYARGELRDFHWGEHIIGVVLHADPGKKGARLCLQPPENGRSPAFNYKAAIQIPEEDGTVFLLKGEARNKWFHGVKGGKGNRLSLTYRSVEFL